MNLSEREQRFLDEIRRVFPDAREVAERGGASGGYPQIGACRSDEPETSARLSPLSVTSQVSLFGQEG